MDIASLLKEFRNYVDDLNSLPLSSKCMIDKVEMLAHIDELIESIPAQIDEANSIVENRERIINEARREANSIRKNSKGYVEELIDNQEVVKSAKNRANEVIRLAKEKQKEINKETLLYADGILKDIEVKLKKSLQIIKEDRDGLK